MHSWRVNKQYVLNSSICCLNSLISFSDRKDIREKFGEDAKATRETVNLYSNLFDLLDKGTMFGAQIPTLYGLDNNKKWYDTVGTGENSDTKYLTGSHPAVCGWELSGIEVDDALNIDGEEFEFSQGFTELHTRSYEKILAGEGFRVSEARPCIEIVSEIRNATPIGLVGDYHPLAKLPLSAHPFGWKETK